MSKPPITGEELLAVAIFQLFEEGKKVHEIGDMFRKTLPDVFHAMQEEKRERGGQ